MYKQPKLAPLGGATYCLRAPRITRLAILFVGLMTLAGTRLATVAHSAVDITIDNLTFAPTTIGEPGTTVKWRRPAGQGGSASLTASQATA